MIRKIVHIDEEKCNGCGLCITACHEEAIELIKGKAKLISDRYCDGLGDCLPACPTDAIKIIEREAVNYDEIAVQKKQEEKKKTMAMKDNNFQGCPGSMAKALQREGGHKEVSVNSINSIEKENKSELNQWPVQLMLVNPKASYLQGANLLIAADCTAYAYGDFHRDFIKNHITIIGCPKLDDNDFYKEKLEEILNNNDIKSITVVRMEVPCCGGIVQAVKTAMLKAETIVPYREVILSTEGNIINQ